MCSCIVCQKSISQNYATIAAIFFVNIKAIPPTECLAQISSLPANSTMLLQVLVASKSYVKYLVASCMNKCMHKA